MLFHSQNYAPPKSPHQDQSKNRGAGVLPAERLNAPAPLRGDRRSDLKLRPSRPNRPVSSAVSASLIPPRPTSHPHSSQFFSSKNRPKISTPFFSLFFRVLSDFGAKILSKMAPKSRSKRVLEVLFGDLFFQLVCSSIFC